MATYAPRANRVTLLDRLVAAELVVVGRSKGVVARWHDDAGQPAQDFAVAEIEVSQVLRGKADGVIRVRLAVQKGQDRPSLIEVFESDADLLLLLAEDEKGDVPQYGLQRDSAFPVKDGLITLPVEIALGEYEGAERPGIDLIRAMIDDSAADRKRREADYAEIDGPDWQSRPYPEVQEIGDPDSERPDRNNGPRDVSSPLSIVQRPRG